MNTRIAAATVALAAGSLLTASCGKNEPAASAPAAPAMKSTGEKVADQAQQAATAVADQAKQAASQFSADTTKQAQVIIDKAKSLVGEKKYQDALNSLQQLAMSKLTPEQTKTVNDLKAQIQKFMSSGAGKAIEGLIKK